MKDLVDVVFYTTNERFDLQELSQAIRAECTRRDMAVPKRFTAPETWKKGFPAFAKKSGIAGEYTAFDTACALASSFFDPALLDLPEALSWDPDSLVWH